MSDQNSVTDADIQNELHLMDKEGSATYTEAPIADDVGVSPEEIEAEAKNIDKYGGRWAETAALSTAGTLTAGVSSRALQSMGLYAPDEEAKMDEYNEYAAPVGTGVGIIGGLLLGDVEGLAGSAARKSAVGLSAKAGSAAEAVLTNVLAKSSSKILAKDIVRKSLQGAAQATTEGALYGLSDLAKENAVGKADFNGENIVNYVGSGALFGGITGAVLPVAGAGIKGAFKGGQKIFDKGMEKYANPTKDFLELALGKKGAAEAMADTTASGVAYREEMLPWVAKKIGKITSDEDLYNKVVKVNREAQAGADDIVKNVGGDMGAQPGLINKGQEVWDTVANQLDQATAHQADFGATGVRGTEYRKLRTMRDEAIKRSESNAPFTPADYRKFRQSYDEISHWKSDAPPAAQAAARQARTTLNEAMHDLVTTIDPIQGAKLKEYFQDMHYTIDMEKALGSKLEKGISNSIMPHYTNILGAAGLVHLIGAPGGIIAAGKQFLESDFKRRMSVMVALKKANVATATQTSSSIANFISSANKLVKPKTVSALMASHLGRGENKQPAKNKQEAYKNISKNLSDYAADPGKLMDRTTIATAALSKDAPMTATAASMTLVRATQFLQAKIPKNPYMDSLPGMKPREYVPSSMELSKFERYMQVVEAPLTVLHELEQGTLTREHVEALQKVYPAMYDFIRTNMIHQMEDNGAVEMSYTKRIQAGMLLDIISDSSLLGMNIAALQENFTVTEKSDGGNTPIVKATQGGAENIDKASRTQTDTQAFTSRRNK